jgi:hypothetical protein
MGPENDAVAMENFAANQQFTTQILTGSKATYADVVAKLQDAANTLDKPDIFLFTFAGHGTATIDTEGDESDNQDEAMLLFDRLLFDDDLRLNIWPNFKPGVRVLMVADCCHAQTILALTRSTLTVKFASVGLAPDAFNSKDVAVRKISSEVRKKHLEEFSNFYEALSVPLLPRPITANILLLAACGDKQTAADGKNGAFTAALLKVLQNDNPVNYTDLIAKVTAELASTSQIPFLTTGGPVDVNFINERPFTI